MDSLNLSPRSKDEPILVVDDDPAAVSALRRILMRSGYTHVLGTSDPVACLEQVRRERPTLIVLDLQMPQMDGFEVLRGIQALHTPESVPAVLVVTAMDDRVSRLRALDAGAGDFLLKPYDPYEVLLRVRNLLEIQGKRRLFSSFLDSTPAAMIGQDADGLCTYVNRTALDLLGYADVDALIGREIHGLIHHSRPDGTPFPRSECPLGNVHLDSTPVRQEGVYWRADGAMLPVEYWAYPLADERQPGASLITFVDISARLESARDQRLASTVFESVDRALVITDARANIVSVNPAYTQLTGWSKEEVLGKNPRFRRSGKQDAAFYVEMWRALLEDGGWEGEIWNLRRDGESYLEEVSIRTVRDGQGKVTHYVAAVRDLTEVKRRSQELELARHRAETANRAKSQFVANISHEIRTPLTAILGFSETLTDDNQSEESRSQAVDAIIRNGRYLQELVNDILDFSRIEADRLEVECVEITLEELLGDVVELGNERAKAKGIEFRIVVEPPWPRTLKTDPTRAKQILINLLTNAIKFTERGSVCLRISLDQAREQLVCAVEDTGIGIESSRIAEIFESFVQADASTARSHGGSGLGLTISKALVRSLGGDLTAVSEPGVGSVFTATLATGPLANVQLQSSPPALSELHPEPLDTPDIPERLHGDILLAEDTPDNRRLISHYINAVGASVTLAENGQQAVELAQQKPFDLVLMDVQMPIMDGLDATRLLRLTGFEGPIVALTANATASDRQEALAAGCDGFLTKPIQRGPFYATLAQYLDVDESRARQGPEDSLTSFDELRESFLKGLPAQLHDLWQAAACHDYDSVARVAHQLKGVAGSFGMPEATRVAGLIEHEAKKHDEEQVVILLRELEDLCGRQPS